MPPLNFFKTREKIHVKLYQTLQVMLALRFYASGSFLEIIGDTMGFDKSTVSRAINDVTKALIAKKNRFIKWPNHEEILKSKQNFFSRGGFPGVIGCIDGTHVRIQAPLEDEAVYVNRKGFHSINVQAICDHEGTYYNKVYIYYLITNWLNREYIKPR